MINVGDSIRVVPSAHEDMAKSGLYYPEHWCQGKGRGDRRIMLGAEYEVISIAHQGDDVWYQVLQDNTNNRGLISSGMAKKSDDCLLCPYKEGDLVFPNPSRKITQEFFDKSAIGRHYNLSDSSGIHRITKILNNLYIFLDSEIGDDWSYPFFWKDFQLVDDGDD